MAIHGEQEAVGVRVHVRGGNPKSAGGKLRFPDGVYHAGLYRSERLQLNSDWRTFGHQRLRDSHSDG